MIDVASTTGSYVHSIIHSDNPVGRVLLAVCTIVALVAWRIRGSVYQWKWLGIVLMQRLQYGCNAAWSVVTTVARELR